jgi:hypothetical protein
MGNRLAEYYSFDDLPEKIQHILKYINWL